MLDEELFSNELEDLLDDEEEGFGVSALQVERLVEVSHPPAIHSLFLRNVCRK